MKEVPGNAQVNQNPFFIRSEQGTGKNEESVLAVMLIGIMSQGKELVSKSCGMKRVLIEEKAYKSSAALSRQETPHKEKDAEDCTSGELQIRKKDAKKNAWNMNNKTFVLKESATHDKKSDERAEIFESIAISNDSDEKEENESVANSDSNCSVEDYDKIKHN